MEPEALITLENVAVRLGRRVLLEGTDLSIRPGENWAVLGPNGSGKTTLAKTLAGLLPVVRGRILRRRAVEGEAGPETIAYVSPEQHKEILSREERVLAARDYSGNVHAVTTVGDLLLDRRPADAPGSLESLARITGRLGIRGLLEKDIQSLSSGEMRKTLVARALMKTPRLLILDEPFDGLDDAARRGLAGTIAHLMNEGVQVVLVTHRQEEIVPGITHLVLLREGAVVQAGRRQEVLESVPEAPAAGLEAAARPGGSARTAPLAARGGTLRQEEKAGEAAVLIDMRAVTVAYRGVRVLDRVDWSMRSGENWMIVGPNGAGKSTLLKLIYADHPQAYANEIYLFGHRVGNEQTVWDIKNRIGLVSAHLQARYRRSIRALDVICSGFFDSVGLYRACSRDQSETAMRWARELGIGAWVEQDFGKLSYGERQLVLLARAMVKAPLLLILDEPCDGLDSGRRRNLLRVLEQIGSRTATNLLYVTHRSQERLACITHTLRLEHGRVVEGASASIPSGDGELYAACRPAAPAGAAWKKTMR
jgi:molybdate transport system ATP-binding protein